MILARVQAHPSRKDLRSALLKALAPLYTEISEHSSVPPDPWQGYSKCLLVAANLDVSHVLVIQDDALPVPNFAAAVRMVADRYPDVPVCLFLGAAPASTAALARRASLKGKTYVPLGPSNFVPMVAVLWPIQKARDFLSWSRGSRRVTRADDANAARWKNETRQEIMVTVPSLVQHNDFVPSVKGGREHMPGKESWRQAILLAEDGLDYDW